MGLDEPNPLIPVRLHVLYDADLRIVWISDIVEPYRREDVIGRPVWAFVIPEESERVQAAMLRVLTSRNTEVLDVTVPHAGRWRMWLHHVALPGVRILEFARKIPPEIERLTSRDRDICRLLVEGLTSKEIAAKLFIARSTVDNLRWQLSRRIGIKPSMLHSWIGAHSEFL